MATGAVLPPGCPAATGRARAWSCRHPWPARSVSTADGHGGGGERCPGRTGPGTLRARISNALRPAVRHSRSRRAPPYHARREADRVPVVRPLVGVAAVAERGPASDALLQSIELAVAAEELGADGAYFRVHHFARQLASPFPLLARDRRPHEPHRDRHRRHRHALREPAVHGRGRRRGGHHRGRAAPAGHQPGVAGAGHRWLAILRVRARRGRDGRRHGPTARRGVPGGAQGRGLRPAESATDVPQPARAAPARAMVGGTAGPDLVGLGHRCDGRLGSDAWA